MLSRDDQQLRLTALSNRALLWLCVPLCLLWLAGCLGVAALLQPWLRRRP
jgi:hypothetical protein